MQEPATYVYQISNDRYGLKSKDKQLQELATYVIRTFQLQRVSSAHVSPSHHLHVHKHLTSLLICQRIRKRNAQHVKFHYT